MRVSICIRGRGFSIDIPSKVANASGVLFYDDAVYKRARFAVGEHESREWRIVCIVVVVLVGLVVVRVVVAVVVAARG